MDSKVKKGKYFVEFENNDGQKNIINMSQIRSVSNKRFVRKIGELKKEDFKKLRGMYASFV